MGKEQSLQQLMLEKLAPYGRMRHPGGWWLRLWRNFPVDKESRKDKRGTRTVRVRDWGFYESLRVQGVVCAAVVIVWGTPFPGSFSTLQSFLDSCTSNRATLLCPTEVITLGQEMTRRSVPLLEKMGSDSGRNEQSVAVVAWTERTSSTAAPLWGARVCSVSSGQLMQGLPAEQWSWTQTRTRHYKINQKWSEI